MFQHRVPKLSIAILLSTIIWTLMSVCYPQPPQAPEQQSTAEQATKERIDDTPLDTFWKWSTHDAVAFYTAVLALFTGTLVVVSAIQIRFLIRADITARRAAVAAKQAANAANAQVRLSKDALINKERAFVLVSKVHAMAGLKGSTGEVIDWSFYCIWENAGGTPTRHMFMQTNWHSFDVELPENFDFPDRAQRQERIPVLLGPKSTTWGAASVVPVELLIAAREKQKRIYMWGWVEYNDVFEGTPRHRTEYCYEIVPVGRPDIAIHGGEAHVPFEYRGYKRHNGADNECFKNPLTSAPLA